MPTPLAPDSYSPYVGEAFLSHAEDGRPLIFTLHEVRPLLDDDLQFSFSLFFRCDDVTLPQRIYRLAHPRLGEIELFLVPVRQRRGGVVYESAFNLLKPEPA